MAAETLDTYRPWVDELREKRPKNCVHHLVDTWVPAIVGLFNELSEPQDGHTKLHQISFLLETIWLFTYSDLKTIVGPQSVFGTLTALAAHLFDLPAKSPVSTIVFRLPLTVFWTWLNLLPFTISNQRNPSSISEDAINKSWRPLPSGRLTSSQALGLMISTYITAIIGSVYMGGLRQCVTLIFLGFCYNDAGGSDSSCVLRNLINACGFVSFASGAMEIALCQRLVWTQPLLQWFALIAVIVFSTVQAQDMSDTEGDELRGRKTVPLVIGDNKARWSIALPVACLSLFCPWYWDIYLPLYLVPLVIGFTVVARTLSYRSVDADKTTFRVWNLWLVSLYCLPFTKHIMVA